MRYYLADSGAGRASWALPAFLRGQDPAGEVVDVKVSAPVKRELEAEAKRQETTPEVLAAHALVYFAADWDSGRGAARLGAALKEDDAETG